MECLYKKVSTINGVLHGQCLHNNSVGKQRNKGVALLIAHLFRCSVKHAYLLIWFARRLAGNTKPIRIIGTLKPIHVSFV